MADAWTGPSIVVFCAIALAVGAAAALSPQLSPRQDAVRLEAPAGAPAQSQVKSADQPVALSSAPPQPIPARMAGPLPTAPQSHTAGAATGSGFGWFGADTLDGTDDQLSFTGAAPRPSPLRWSVAPSFAVSFDIDPVGVTEPPAVTESRLPMALDIGAGPRTLRNMDYGALSFGIGATATQEISEIDLSGTQPVARSNVAATTATTGEALYFENGTKLSGAFFNLDGGSTGRVVYRTPVVGGLRAAIAGRQVGNTMAPDLSLTYAGVVNGWDIAAGIGYRREPGRVGKDVVHGSASLLAPFGTNLTVAAGAALVDDDWGDDRTFVYAKLGQRIDWSNMGETRLALDVFYGQPNDTTASLSVGGGLVHAIPALSTDLFLGARTYSLDLAGADPDDIVAVYSGALFRF